MEVYVYTRIIVMSRSDSTGGSPSLSSDWLRSGPGDSSVYDIFGLMTGRAVWEYCGFQLEDIYYVSISCSLAVSV